MGYADTLEIISSMTKRSEDSTFCELSHIVEDGMITYPGLPAPVVCDFLSRKESRFPVRAFAKLPEG